MNSEFGFLFSSMTSCTFHKLPQSGDVDISWITKQLWLPPFLFYLYVCTGTRWTCKLPMKRLQLTRTILLWDISANYCITHALTFKIFKSSVIVETFFMGTTLLVILDQTIRFFLSYYSYDIPLNQKLEKHLLYWKSGFDFWIILNGVLDRPDQ